MIDIEDFIPNFYAAFSTGKAKQPWEITDNLEKIIMELLMTQGSDYTIENNIAIHKTAVIFDNSSIAHFNFIGNSVIGRNVNFEAGSITVNHYNERKNKQIFATHLGKLMDTQTEKFGSLVGDNSKIGANAVLSPGTILEMNSIVKRLELIEQVK